jgi:hypothetical protein
MQVAPARLHDSTPLPHSPLPTAWYSVLGVPVAVTSDVAEVLLRVDETYAAFRAAPGDLDRAIVLRLLRSSETPTFVVSDTAGRTPTPALSAGAGNDTARHWPNYQDALIDLFDRMVHALLARLLAQGMYAIHAGAVVYGGAGLVLAGRSGQGKTTLTLGLLRRGLGLLSDEFAVVDPAARRLVPYRRSLHVRPGTPELIPELRFLHDRPRHQLGGGSEWAVTPSDLERALPGCLAPAAQLRYVLLLDGMPSAGETPLITPIPAALAALELLRGAWAASVDFAGVLAQISLLLDRVSCARLRVGPLEPTLDAILTWLEARDG